jgi:hypothetical protein
MYGFKSTIFFKKLFLSKLRRSSKSKTCAKAALWLFHFKKEATASTSIVEGSAWVTVSKFWSRTLRLMGADEWGDLSHWCNMHISDIIAGRQGEVSFRFIRLWLRPLTHKSAPPRAPAPRHYHYYYFCWARDGRKRKDEQERDACAFAASAAAQTRLL